MRSAAAARNPAARLVDAARGENFPVASRLIPKRLRGRVVAFYNYARAADDAADDPWKTPEQRLERLADLERGLLEGTAANPGATLRRALADGSAPADAAALAASRDLLVAFRRDAGGIACADWDDLQTYCTFSARPVGRFLLAIHEEAADTHAPSDALCDALQVLNHLQDIAADRRDLGRRYLPGEWMAGAGASDDDLTRDALTPGLRQVVDRTLDACDELLSRAAPLPGRIAARGLRGQATATLALANRLSRRLRAGDPLADRIAPSRTDFLRAGLAGLWAAR
ncbi:squalene/phytoene synthase family protein [Jannaschia seosinensis]|nr:squalene/phytoene synthase family protein [Jannaschia seosinensis]